eukprot:scaffold4675_cov127-Amphora_coffeaeformis.AAC.2
MKANVDLLLLETCGEIFVNLGALGRLGIEGIGNKVDVVVFGKMVNDKGSCKDKVSLGDDKVNDKDPLDEYSVHYVGLAFRLNPQGKVTGSRRRHGAQRCLSVAYSSHSDSGGCRQRFGR